MARPGNLIDKTFAPRLNQGTKNLYHPDYAIALSAPKNYSAKH